MSLTQNLKAAWRVVTAQPKKVILLALPVCASAALALATLAIQHGVNAKAHEGAASYGLDLVNVHGAARVIAGKFSTTATLTDEDLYALRAELRGVKHVLPTVRQNEVPISYGSKNGVYKVFGVTPPWAEARNFGAERGQFFDQTDVDTGALVCLIGHTVKRELFGDDDPVGKDIVVNQISFKVKGLLVARGASPAEGDRDARIVIPQSTFSNRLYKRVHLDQIIIQVADPTEENLALTAEKVRTILRRQHHLSEGQPEDFTVRTPMSVTEESRLISESVFHLLLGLALVGAVIAAIIIGIVFQQAIRSRWNEIGLRRALGARPADILQQIGFEGLTISLLGGLGGMVLGIAAASLIANWRQLPVGWNFAVVGIPLLLAVLTSLASWIAARKAARLSPSEALRNAV